MAKCRLCGKELRELEGSYLERINGKGGTGIWECRPRCGSGLPQDLVLLSALNVGTEIEHDYTFLKPSSTLTYRLINKLRNAPVRRLKWLVALNAAGGSTATLHSLHRLRRGLASKRS